MRIINFDDGFTSSTAPTLTTPATGVSVTPTGNLASTNAQAALVELQGDINTLNTTVTSLGTDKINLTEKGAVNGVAQLDAGGKVPTAQLPDAVLGSVKYQGTWNASTNTPTLSDGSGSQGHYYVVSVDGATSLNGITDWKVGDWVVSNSTPAWQKVDNTEAVVSVSGKVGVVTLDKADVGLSNVDNTSDTTKNAATATLTNKTLTTPIFNDYVDVNEESAPSTPGAGVVRVYAKTDKKIYTKDSAGTETQVGAGGSGELNLIDNPSDSVSWSSTGWVGAAATTTTAGDLPLAGITDTAIKITSDTSAGTEAAEYVSYAFTTPASLSAKLKVEFYMRPGSNFIASEWTVSIYAGAVRQSLSTDASSVTYLPNFSGKFTTTFDCVASTAYTVRFARPVNAGANAGILNVANVIVGPGIQPQGAMVGRWTIFTMAVGAPTPPTKGTVAHDVARWRRVGESMEIVWRYRQTVAGTAGTGSYTFAMPSGYTVDTAAVELAQRGSGNVGVFHASSSGVTTEAIGFVRARTTTLLEATVQEDDVAPTDVSATVQSLSNAVQKYYLWALIPIAEWAGSGTINLAQNDVEWAADDGTNDVFGPNGALVPNQAFATGNVSRAFAFPTGKQDTDLYILEVNYRGFGWSQMSDLFIYNCGNNGVSSNCYGAQGAWTSATAYTVSFGSQGTRVNISSSSNGNSAWATEYAAGTRFRVRKIAGGNAVGFGLATQTSSGLIPSYVKGTFAPALVKSGGGGTLGANTTVTASYVKMGSLCHIELVITPITITVGTINLAFTLPFAAKNLTRAYINTLDNSTVNNGRVILAVGSTTAELTPSISSSGWAISAAATSIYAHFSYEVNE